jgi:hypothetical protein
MENNTENIFNNDVKCRGFREFNLITKGNPIRKDFKSVEAVSAPRITKFR